MGNKDPLVSIIIPTYNCERYIKECIDSIVNQSYSNLEILLIDDGSMDKTEEMNQIKVEKPLGEVFYA